MQGSGLLMAVVGLLLLIAAVPGVAAVSLASTLLAVFGSVALVLAGVGIYGVMSYSVNLRSQEIGIRMALGAERRDVLWMVLRQGMTIVAIGLASSQRIDPASHQHGLSMSQTTGRQLGDH